MTTPLAEPAVIVGLGNPGQRYEKTRHNAGFLLLDFACSKLGITPRWQERDGYWCADLTVGTHRVFFIKPQTYMNQSGEPLQSFLNFRKLNINNLVVCHDELDLALGAVRFKYGGGDGGHNGLKSIATHCGGTEYIRLRLGIGRPEIPPGADKHAITSNWVLSNINADPSTLSSMLGRGFDALALLLDLGFQEAQNRTNRG
jgi:PTH1 family peptidyl-tRNA hydrolase